MARFYVDFIIVPYDSGHRAGRMGAGPLALMDGGLPSLLEARGHDVRALAIEASSWQAEVGTAFELAASIASAVRSARALGRFPIVLAGNCGAAIGVVAGLGQGCEVVWLDAHADFNTPETTVSDFLDGMALATVAGRCWTALAARVPGFAAVAQERIRLLGARELDAAEVDALAGSGVRRVGAAGIGDAAASASRATRHLTHPSTCTSISTSSIRRTAARTTWRRPEACARGSLSRFARAWRRRRPLVP